MEQATDYIIIIAAAQIEMAAFLFFSFFPKWQSRVSLSVVIHYGRDWQGFAKVLQSTKLG
jgi:hypothetical protein